MSNSVSDSGGYEGSQKVLSLGRNGSGTFTYSYEMYTIPDQLIVRYDGRDLLNTGFVSGSRTGTVKIPKGQSTELQVILATNNAGTAWDYSISENGCADPDPYVLTVVGGDWQDKDNDGDCDATGTILVGYKGGQSLLRIENAVAEYDENGLRILSGSTYSAQYALSGALFKGSFDLDFKTGKATVQDDASDTGEHKLAAMNYGVSGMTVGPRTVTLDIGPQLPSGLGGVVLLPSQFPDLAIGSNGLALDRTTVGIPFTFPIGGKWEVDSPKLDISYDGAGDKLKIEGEFGIKSPLGGGRKYTVKTVEGKPFVYGPDGVEGRIEIGLQDLDFSDDGRKSGKFGISDITLFLDFQTGEVGGKLNLSLPGFGKCNIKGFEASMGGVFSPRLEIGSFSVKVTGDIPIGATGWFGKSVGFSAENLLENDGKASQWSVSGEVGFGPDFMVPKIGKVNLLTTSGTISGGADKWETSAVVKLVNIGNFCVAEATGKAEYDVTKSTLTLSGTKSILNGFITTSDTMKLGFDRNFSLYAGGRCSLNVPKNSLPLVSLLSGKAIAGSDYAISFTDDGDFSNDFIAGWTTISLPTFQGLNVQFKDQTIGLRYTFDDLLTPKLIDATDISMLTGGGSFASQQLVGAKAAPTLQTVLANTVTVPKNAATVLFAAVWDNADPNATLRLTAPDGTVYDEKDFAAAGIGVVTALSDATSRVAGAAGLTEGGWTVSVQSSVNLGTVTVKAIAGENAPTLTLGSTSADPSGGFAVSYTLDDPDSVATLSLFATESTSGTGGIRIASGLAETANGSFVWNTANVAPGTYTIYGVADDGRSAPVRQSALGSVTVSAGTDLTVRTNVQPAVVRGQPFDVGLSVDNLGSGTATGTTLRVPLPNGVEFIGASVAAQVVDGAVQIALGDVPKGETRDLTISLKAPATLGTFDVTAEVASGVYDVDRTDNTDANTVQVVASNLADLVVKHGALPANIVLGTPFEFTATVSNEGLAAASGVVLRETLPSEVSLITASGTQGRLASVSNGVATFDVGQLNPGASTTVTFRAMPNAAGNYVAVAEASLSSSTVVERLSSNNVAVAMIDTEAAPPGPADLSIQASANVASAAVGDTVSFTLTLNNSGPGTASGIKVAAPLPGGLSFLSFSALQGSYDRAAGVWDVGNMRDGLTRQLTLTAKVERKGSLALLAEIASSGEPDKDSTPGNRVIGEDDAALVAIAVDNAPPTAAGDSYTTTAGTALSVAAPSGVLANDSDPDQDGLFARLTSGPQNGTLTLRADGGFTYVPAQGFVGTDQWSYAATDGTGSATATASVVIAPADAASAGADRLTGTQTAESIYGLAGDDTITGGGGNDTIDGGDGDDVCIFTGSMDRFILRPVAGGYTVEDTTTGDRSLLRNIESIRTDEGTVRLGSDLGSLVKVAGATGDHVMRLPKPYKGPVGYLSREYLGSGAADVIGGTTGNDFINSFGGVDAVDAGQGDDVIDGGAGSNWLVGGTGTDTYFVDARNTDTTWSTIADLEKNEWTTLWGFQQGVSRLSWEEMNGAGTYKGATAHCDIDGNGSIDASITFTGYAVSDLLITGGNVDGTLYLAFTKS